MSASSRDGPSSADGEVSATLGCVESMSGRRILTKPTLSENGFMDLVNHEIPDPPTEVIRELLPVSCEYNLTVWMSS